MTQTEQAKTMSIFRSVIEDSYEYLKYKDGRMAAYYRLKEGLDCLLSMDYELRMETIGKIVNQIEGVEK